MLHLHASLPAQRCTMLFSWIYRHGLKSHEQNKKLRQNHLHKIICTKSFSIQPIIRHTFQRILLSNIKKWPLSRYKNTFFMVTFEHSQRTVGHDDLSLRNLQEQDIRN